MWGWYGLCVGRDGGGATVVGGSEVGGKEPGEKVLVEYLNVVLL